MALKAQRLLDHALHTLGNQALEARLDAFELINQAQDHFVQMHPWTWSTRHGVLLDMVSGQRYVIFPADFMETVAFEPTDASNLNFLHSTTLAQIDQLYISNQIAAANTEFWWALTWGENAISGELEPRAALYPEPISSSVGHFRLSYHARLREIAKLSDSILIPPYMHNLLIQVVRAFARGFEEEDDGSLSARLQLIENGPIFQRAISLDGRGQPDLGPLRGGIGGTHRTIGFHEVDELQAPS